MLRGGKMLKVGDRVKVREDIYNTTEENVEDKIFYGHEIQGKWYIND